MSFRAVCIRPFLSDVTPPFQQEIDFTRPTAFVLGNETAGVSDEAVALSDYCAMIPMHGFVDSLNISVAASLIM